MAGSPKSGPIYLEKQRACLEYKRAIRRAKANDSVTKNDALHDKLVSRDLDSFWKNFNALNGRLDNFSCIDGCFDKTEIANCFRETYSKVYQTNDSHADNLLRHKFADAFEQYSRSHIAADIIPHIFHGMI